jgi:glycine cleavage system H lipoate-binding protein
MNPVKHTPWRDVLRVAGLTLAAMIAMPAIAVLLFFARAALLFVLIAAVAAGLVALVLSPRFREWMRYVGEPVIPYKGLELASDVAMAPGHVWARVSGDEALVGADDLMQAALGPVDAVDLPVVGRRVEAGEPLFRLHNGTRALSGRSPVTGIVVAVNEALRGDPRRINTTPFTDGWAVRVASQDMKRERQGLRRGTGARELFRREVDRMLGVVAAAEGVPVLADGGEVVGEIHRHIDDETWKRLQKAVFADPAESADVA